MNPSAPPLLDLRNVTVLRGPNVALDRLSLRIAVGEHVCILGPNGSGKSTLIKTLTRECYPLQREDSTLSILGSSLWNIFELRSSLGIVSPDLLAACTTDATCLDVVISGFFSSTRIFPNHQPLSEHRARAHDALARMGIAHLAHRPVLEMSSGEAKRTLIARALVHDPHTLLFDEPGNTLDIAGQLELRHALRELARAASASSSSLTTSPKSFRRLTASSSSKKENCSPMDPRIRSSPASSFLLSLMFPFDYFAKTAISISTLKTFRELLFCDAIRDVRGDRHSKRFMLVSLHHQKYP